MKKIFALILALVMLLTLLSACGKKADTSTADAYLSMAQDFLDKNNVDSAIDILNKGYAETKDARLSEKLIEIYAQRDNTKATEPSSAETMATTAPATKPQATEAPSTKPVATKAPTTKATTPPATKPTTTQVPTTNATTTPTTKPVETNTPTTKPTTPPTTKPVETNAPTTKPTTPPATNPPATTHTHTYSTKVTAATCTEQGYTTYTCACGHSYKADYISTTVHNYSKTVTAATCTEQGYTTYTCSCGDSYVGDYTSSTHSYVNYVCSKCGTVDKSHAYEYLMEWVKTNGTQDGEDIEYIFDGKNNSIDNHKLVYSISSNYLYIWHSDTTTGFVASIAIDLSSYYYGFFFGNDSIYGFINPSIYTRNTDLTYTKSDCSVLTPQRLLSAAKTSVDLALVTLENFFLTNGFDISIADLGFTSFEY